MTLPLPNIGQGRRLPVDGSVYYVTSSVDRWGRLGARSVLSFLGWTDGQSVTFTVDRTTTCFSIRAASVSSTVVRRGELRLPAYIRQSCGIDANDRLLLRADYRSQVIFAITPEGVEELIHPRLQFSEGGGRA